jgi:hypothetical protein
MQPQNSFGFYFACTHFSPFCRGLVQETAAADKPGVEAPATAARGAGSQQVMADVPSEERVRPMITFEVIVTGGYYPHVIPETVSGLVCSIRFCDLRM